jgi:phage baseplate assembly protein W
LGRWEPRIAIEAVDVGPDPEEPRSAIATIRYRLVATGISEILDLSVPVAASGVSP